MTKVFLLGLILAFLAISEGQLLSKGPFPARGFAKVLNEDEAERRLSRYRSFLVRDLNQSVHHQAYALRFKLRHMPRRGDESSREGLISGPSLGHGISRIDLDSGEEGGEPVSILLHNSSDPQAWRYRKESARSLKLEHKDLLLPLVEGMNQTPFDILMPFVFWGARYEKSGKVAGRPAHIYAFSLPEWVREARPDWNRVTLALDDDYEAPLRVQTFSSRSVPVKTFILNSLKKIDSTWIVKRFDCKNGSDLSNTRFEVLSVALRLDLDPISFSPKGLGRRLEIPQELFVPTN